MAFSANIFGPNTGVSMASRREGATDQVANKGRRGDQSLIHASPFTRSLLKAMGGAGTINPKTGLMEFYSIGFSDIGGVDPTPASESDFGTSLGEAGYLADDDYISGLDNIAEGAGNFVSGLYQSVGRGDTMDKQGTDWWANDFASGLAEGLTSQEAMARTTGNFLDSASLVDEQRDTAISNIESGVYDQFFSDIGVDKNDYITRAQNVVSEFGTIDQLGSLYADEISANNLTADTTSLGEVAQRVIDSGNERIIAGDKIGYTQDLVGMDSSEFQQMFDAAAQNEFTVKGLEGSQAQLKAGVDNIAQMDTEIATAVVNSFNNLSEGEQLQIQSNVARGGDATQLLLNVALVENNGNIGGNDFSNVGMGDVSAVDVLGDNVITADSSEQEIFDTFVQSGMIDEATTNEIINNGLTAEQVEEIVAAYTSATGNTNTDGMSASEIIAELQNMYNMSNYNPLAFLNAFGFALDPTYLGQIIPTLSTGLTGAYTTRRVRDRETGEYRTIRVPISPEAINATARNQRRAGFGSVISV